jgi:putative ABC transport system permease protein
MYWVAWKMLTGDRAKYFGLIFGIAFASMLMAQQMSIFCSLMLRTASQVLDIDDAPIWVMNDKMQNADEIQPLTENDYLRVRGVAGVAWAVQLYKGQLRARTSDGSHRTVVLMGVDDATLVGAPRHFLAGSLADLRRPDAIVVDEAGYSYLWPGQPPRPGHIVEINDRRAVLVGICRAKAPFQTFPVLFTRYSQARRFAPSERNVLSFVLARPEAGSNVEEVCARITEQTGLRAMPRDKFVWKIIGYYLATTGIPVNFGITVFLGFVVGTAVSGQTFYLFVLENTKHFGSLKAMGVSDRRILGMVLLQAAVVGSIGYGLGMGLASGFFAVTRNMQYLRGFFMPWQVMAGTAVAVAAIVFLASLLSIRRVWKLEPAIVFRV